MLACNCIAIWMDLENSAREVTKYVNYEKHRLYVGLEMYHKDDEKMFKYFRKGTVRMYLHFP
jgi:hypothetical protein